MSIQTLGTELIEEFLIAVKRESPEMLEKEMAYAEHFKSILGGFVRWGEYIPDNYHDDSCRAIKTAMLRFGFSGSIFYPNDLDSITSACEEFLQLIEIEIERLEDISFDMELKHKEQDESDYREMVLARYF